MTTRRSFLKKAAIATSVLPFASLSACSTQKAMGKGKSLKISLAQWSLNRSFFAGKLDAKDFAAISKNTYKLDAVEYVNGFYKDFASNETFWQDMKRRSDAEGVKNLLIMVDAEGYLGNLDDSKRMKAVENHYKWVNAAKILNCHSIRVNAFGDGEKETVKSALIDGMGRLCEYAAKEKINVLIENHGLYSSNGAFVASVMKGVNKSNCGTLPDFGNWCLNAKWGGTSNNKCSEAYDFYKGVSEFMPYAKGLSAKSYKFNEQGEETTIDYYKMLKIAKEAGYNGYVGI
jgi:sugar phosphate isomerase/epimerase